MFKLHHFSTAIVYMLFLDEDVKDYIKSYLSVEKEKESVELLLALIDKLLK